MRLHPLLLIPLLLAGCDSQSRLTATLPTSNTPPILAVTQSTLVEGSTVLTKLAFPASALPVELQNANSLTMAIGGHPIGAISAGPGTLAVLLPPSTPFQTDLNGNVTVAMTRDSALTDLVNLHVTVTP